MIAHKKFKNQNLLIFNTMNHEIRVRIAKLNSLCISSCRESDLQGLVCFLPMHTRIWVFVCYGSVIIIHDFCLYFDVFWYFGLCQVMFFFGVLAQVLIRWAKFCQLHPNDLKERKWLVRIVFILMLCRVNCVWWGIITQNYWVLESFLLGTNTNWLI